MNDHIRKCPHDGEQLIKVSDTLQRAGYTYAKYECIRCTSTWLIGENGTTKITQLSGPEMDSFDRIAYA